ncbi:MAG TPA: ATP-binding cassette domain-containing protein [Synergistaceae bacterium]|nr:ATP-binding cassette domain-containing protein [Synergistaceae bacterium]
MHAILENTPILEFHNVSFGYENRRVLEDVTLSVSSREFASIVGPNGGGKTTLLKLALGLLTPRKGRVTLFGTSPE